MLNALPKPEDHFRDSVAQSAMMIDLREAEVFERHVFQAMHRGVDIGRTGAYVLK
jgi:hypothetical protein